MDWMINRNENGERQSTFCTEHSDRSITVTVGHFETLISPAEIADLRALAGEPTVPFELIRRAAWIGSQPNATFSAANPRDRERRK
jgi:hypothetical protein